MSKKFRDHITAATFRYVVEYGWSVIPISLDDKKPMVKWLEFQGRRPTTEEIWSWHGKEHNIAVLGGTISNLVIVDTESKPTAQRWLTTHKTDLMPRIVKTKRGYHFYYQQPEHEVQGNRAKVFGKDMDIRGEGGYVLAPPSRHSEGYYKTERTGPPANRQFATKMLPMFRTSWLPKKTEYKPDEGLDISNGVKYISKITAVSGQDGHGNTYRAVCCLRKSGMDKDSAYAAMLMWNETNADPPWSQQEIRHKVEDAYK